MDCLNHCIRELVVIVLDPSSSAGNTNLPRKQWTLLKLFPTREGIETSAVEMGFDYRPFMWLGSGKSKFGPFSDARRSYSFGFEFFTGYFDSSTQVFNMLYF